MQARARVRRAVNYDSMTFGCTAADTAVAPRTAPDGLRWRPRVLMHWKRSKLCEAGGVATNAVLLLPMSCP